MASPRKVLSIINGADPHWVGDGFPVRTIFSAHAEDPSIISPFLLLDYAGPQEFPPSPEGKPRGVEEHPHRGFETVTIVYQGELEHRDSSGNRGRIGPGDVQWMTAASGVVHEEKHAREFTELGGTLELIQLWVNLPANEKMSTPRYQEILENTIPLVDLPEHAGFARIIAGELLGTRGPARTVTQINLWDVRLKAGASAAFTLPAAVNALVFLLRGGVNINQKVDLTTHDCAIFDRAGDSIRISAIDDSTLLILSGEPIDEPVAAHGPFVMNTREEIKQAMQDYQAGRLGRLEPATGA